MRAARVAQWGLVAAPALLAAWMVGHFAVDMPFWDEWVFATFIAKVKFGGLSFRDFWEQYNESRKIFPRLIMVALGRATNFDVRAWMWFSWCLSVATLVGIAKLARMTIANTPQTGQPRTRGKSLLPPPSGEGGGEGAFGVDKVLETRTHPFPNPPPAGGGTGERNAASFPLTLNLANGMAPKAGTPFDETTTTLAAASLLLFSPTQYQNFLWGIQIVVFVPAACLIWGLVVAQSSSSPWTKWVIAAGICIVATYSYSNGMLCWLLVLPALWRNWPTPRRKMLAGSWIFAAAVAVGIYRLGIPGVLDAYVKPAWTPALDVVAHRPMDAGKFFLAFLGQPLAEVFEPLGLNRVMTISDFCASVGAALLLMFAVAAIVAIRKSPSALPWICFGAYTLLSGILTTFGRLGFGVDFAVTPRYRTFGLYMIIATIYLGAMIAASSARRIAATICWLKVGLCTLFIIAMPSGLRRAAGFRTRELQGKGCLAFIDLIESAGIHTKVQDQYSPLRPRADLLDQAGYLHPPLVHATAMEQIAKSDGDVYGQFEGLQRSGNRCAAGGWAILPNRHEPSDVVVLAYQSTDGAHPFAILDTFVGRSDVAMALSDRRYSNCGWTGAFDAKDVPKDAGISAWAFDALSGKTHQLAGSFTLPGEQ